MSSILAASLLAFGAAGLKVQPDIRTYRSVEVIALSGANLVGRAVRIQPPAPGGEQVLVSVVFNDCQSLLAGWGGKMQQSGSFLAVDHETVQKWIESKNRILTFDHGSWINLDDPREVFFDSKLNPIKGVENLVRQIRETQLKHPETERVRTFYRMITQDESKRLGIRVGSQVAVPWDQEVEQWAVECLKSKDPGR